MMSVIQVNGTQLTYVEEGQGQPLILVHGSLGDYRGWEPQMPVFAQHFRTIAYSRRYHYPNPWSGSVEYSALHHADDLAAFITALELGRAHLVGGSYGAFTVLCLAVRYPELVRTLVLGEPPVLSFLEQSEEGRVLAAAHLNNAINPARQAFGQGQLEEGMRRFVNGVIGPGTFDNIPSAIRANMMDHVRELQGELLTPQDVLYPALSCAEVGQVTAPTLLLTGELSPRLFHRITDELERCLPNAARVMLAGVSHGLKNNVEAYNATVLAFLERQSGNL